MPSPFWKVTSTIVGTGVGAGVGIGAGVADGIGVGVGDGVGVDGGDVTVTVTEALPAVPWLSVAISVMVWLPAPREISCDVPVPI